MHVTWWWDFCDDEIKEKIKDKLKAKTDRKKSLRKGLRAFGGIVGRWQTNPFINGWQ